MSRQETAQSPVRPGQEISVTVHGLGSSGEGVARYEGLTIFVPGGAPGDRLLARVAEVKKNYARAALVAVEEPSPDRVAPPCPVVAECGGCQLQHIAYGAQLRLKRQQVVDALERLGKLSGVTVHPTLGMEDPWHYRNKAQFPVGWRSGRVIAGFFAPGTHRIVDIEQCDIQHPLGNRIMAEVKALAGRYGVRIYDERTHTGVLRHVLARVGRGTGEAMAVLVTNGPDFPHGGEIARELMARIPALVSVVQNINPARTNVVLGRESRVLAGRGHITDYIGDLKFNISPVSFFQVNPAQTEVLYGKALEYAGLTGGETVVDLYCGIGTISLFLARQCREVIGIEWVEEAVADARENARRNEVHNARFIAGDAAVEMPRLAEEGVRADVIVLDPPRKGCDEPVLEAIAAVAPRRVVYVSCNPASLARDLGRLAGMGYRTVEVQPVDMFPHTAHVECVARVERVDG
ncbi:23S rRNA (uracil(1939)-C(5))-methyltransferase RlmD [Symbiobacterium terraclitae]|uniref:23S rRNA (uracil(1939)-C(5))-methyltransferase RlmD n=1 Tax=Symbiobacterium terraclitae TaxID=557451 RepID=UPI0035B567CF